MLIVALVLAVIGLAALITAVVTSNELVAWVCIAASALGVVLLIIDAVRERKHSRLAALTARAEADEDSEDAPFIATAENAGTDTEFIEYTDEIIAPEIMAEDHPEELVHDEPEYDLPSDDEPEFAAPAEESAVHIVDEQSATDPAVDDQIVVLQAADEADSTAVIEHGDTGYDRDDH